MAEYILIDRTLVETMSELLEMISTALECGALVAVDREGQHQELPTDSLRKASGGLKKMVGEASLPPEIITLLRHHLQQAGDA